MKLQLRGLRKYGRAAGLLACTSLVAAFSVLEFTSANEPAGSDAIVIQASSTLVTFAGGSTKVGGHLKVRIDGPNGDTVYEASSKAGILDWAPASELPDGVYRYDVWFSAAPGTPPKQLESMADRGKSTLKPAVYQSGQFRVRSGTVMERTAPSGENGWLKVASAEKPGRLEYAVGWVLRAFTPEAIAGVSHGTASVTIDGQNPNILLNDTDSTGGTVVWNPRTFGTDFQLLEFNCLSDCTGPGDNPTPFVVEDDGLDNSLFIESTGDIGLGTSTPTDPLHVMDSFPAIRLEETGGLSPSDWRIDGDADFSIRDVGSATTPFSIDEGAPSGSLEVDPGGNIGLGTLNAAKQLHVRGSDTNQLGQNNVMLQVENIVGDQGPRRMIELINNGSPLLVYKDTARGTVWNMSPVGNSFAISLSGTGAQEFLMDGDGNAEFQGDVTANGVVLDSSRALKTDFSPVDSATMLEKVAALDISQWRYKDEAGTERHVGPMAEDFQRIFGLGDGKHLDMVDTTGVTLAAIKALRAENSRKDSRISALEERIERLERLLDD